MKRYIYIYALLWAIGLIPAHAATYNTTPAGGTWSNNTTWTGPDWPSNWGNHTANVYGNVTVTGNLQGFQRITINNGRTFTSNASRTLQNIANFDVIDGNVVINGDLTLMATNMTITSGNLTVTGTLILSNGSTLTFNSSGNVNVGAITTSGSGGTLNMNNGALTVNDLFALNSGSAANIGAAATVNVGRMNIGDSNSAILTNNGTFTIANNITQAGVINNFGTMNVGGSLTSTGSGNSRFTNSGRLNVTQNVTLPSSGKLYVNPGGVTIVDGNVTVGSNENLIVGTNVAPPAYADLVIRSNLISTGSGDVTINRNGRFAIFGDVTDSGGGGTLFRVNNGGQVYVDGDINYSGGGSAITNNNTTNPFGLYVNGTVNNTGGGSTTTTNMGDENTMYTTNRPFYDWVQSFMTPLPVTLTYFTVKEISTRVVVLAWSTASEKNFYGFEIERSVDGKNFVTIGKVNSASQSGTETLTYTFDDFNPQQGRTYYRLKMIDLDYSFAYSNLVMATLEAAPSALRLYPNPVVHKNFTVELNDVFNSPVSMRVISMTGYVAYTAVLDQDQTHVELPEDINAGVYLVQLSSQGGQQAIKIVVQ